MIPAHFVALTFALAGTSATFPSACNLLPSPDGHWTVMSIDRDQPGSDGNWHELYVEGGHPGWKIE